MQIQVHTQIQTQIRISTVLLSGAQQSIRRPRQRRRQPTDGFWPSSQFGAWGKCQHHQHHFHPFRYFHRISNMTTYHIIIISTMASGQLGARGKRHLRHLRHFRQCTNLFSHFHHLKHDYIHNQRSHLWHHSNSETVDIDNTNRCLPLKGHSLQQLLFFKDFIRAPTKVQTNLMPNLLQAE